LPCHREYSPSSPMSRLEGRTLDGVFKAVIGVSVGMENE
jgi:hypothetical protein